MKKLLFLIIFLVSCITTQSEDDMDTTVVSAKDNVDYGDFLAAEYASLNSRPDIAVKYIKQVLKKDSENTDVLKNAYNAYAISGDIKNANIYAKKVLKDNPTFFTPAYISITHDILNKNYDDALKTIGKMEDVSFNLYIKPFVTSWIYAGKGDFENAYKALAPMDNDKVFQAIYNFNLALLAEMEKDSEKAKKHYVLALTNTSGLSLTAVKLLGKRLGDLGDTELSKEIKEKYREINFLINDAVPVTYEETPPVSIEYAVAEVYLSLASIIPSSDSYNRDFAIIFYNLALYLYPDFSLAKIFLGDTLTESKNYDFAKKTYQSVATESEYYLAAQLKLARIYALEGDIPKAHITFFNLADRYPTIVEPYLEMGDIYRLDSKFEKAEEAYSLALKRTTRGSKVYWIALYNRGICLERLNRWKEAEQDISEALSFNQNNPYILNYLGYCWLDRGLNLKKAFAMVKKAYELAPNDGHITDSIAWAYYLMGDYEKALAYMEKALSLVPGNSVINDHLGDIYWELKRKNEARYQWSKALELDTDIDEKDRLNINKKLKYGKAKNVPKFKIEEVKNHAPTKGEKPADNKKPKASSKKKNKP